MDPKPRGRFTAYRSAEEIAAIQEKRKAKRQANLDQPKPNELPDTRLLQRPWLSFDSIQSTVDFKILTWNLLAQCLVRRELFPTSNCLKSGQREPLIHQEILRLDADILCLQEVDRMDKLGPMLDQAGYSYRSATGPRKLHGCLIAYKSAQFQLESERVVFYDDEEVRSEGSETQRRGKSFQTRNIGLVLALRTLDNTSGGVIISTTHLFWHPRYTYERARQAGILAREVSKFRQEEPVRHTWPCILAGDFNFPPDDPGYALLTGTPLLPEQRERLLPSYVVHNSVDPTQVQNAVVVTDTDEAGEAVDPDRVITNARPAQPTDGLLDINELIDLFSRSSNMGSSYEVGLRQYITASDQSNTDQLFFGANGTISTDRPGYYEPRYTSYTHYWKSVLDYIFIFSDTSPRVHVAGLLTPLHGKVLEPGLPKQEVCGSDHLPLMVRLQFQMV